MKKYLPHSLILYCAVFNTAGAQLTTSQLLGQLNTITTAVPFLLIGPDSRAGGMGDAGCATSPDAFSTHWNPSKLAFAEKKMGLGIAYTPWLRALVPDINLAYVSFFYKPNVNGTFSTSMKYFSLGNITFTNAVGNPIGQYNPSEFALDMSYALLFSRNFSGAMSVRYIHSNLTSGVPVNGAASHAGNSVAVDLSANYRKSSSLLGKFMRLSTGINISNVGTEMSYTNTGNKDFLPMNLRIGQAVDIVLDERNSISFCLDLNKLLVPTPPVYQINPATGTPVVGANGQYVILYGSNPNVGVLQAIPQSFHDAPGGMREELNEIIICGGIEYWRGKPKWFCVRAGYFNEAATKGNRKYFTFGLGFKYKEFGLDLAYLIPTVQRNPLQNTLRFAMTFDFGRDFVPKPTHHFIQQVETEK